MESQLQALARIGSLIFDLGSRKSGANFNRDADATESLNFQASMLGKHKGLVVSSRVKLLRLDQVSHSVSNDKDRYCSRQAGSPTQSEH